MTRPRSLQQQLIAWVLAALLLVWASFIVVGYRTGEHEADELTDGHLASVAALLLSQSPGAFTTRGNPAPVLRLTELKNHDYQQSLSVVVWDRQGNMLTRMGQAPTPAFDLREGFASLVLGDPPTPWRSFSRWDGSEHERKVVVLLSARERDELAEDIAEQITEPGLWLLPVIALALGLAIQRGLRPLRQLASQIHELNVRQPTPLPDLNPQQEIRTIVQALNMLIARYQDALKNERDLASELAHELRTPLASLNLFARNLRAAESESERQTALTLLEQEVARASLVMSELLALARVERSALAEAKQSLELSEIARQVLADHAQAAQRSGHELAMSCPGPMKLSGHPLLLELALRNLVENALVHTGRGSCVEIQLDPEAGWIQVCDNGGQCAPGSDSPWAHRSESAAGLGLGHRVVEKIAAVHGARFEKTAAPHGFSSCFRLSFAALPDPRPAAPQAPAGIA